MKFAYFAGGCFWGVEYYMLKCTGVLSVKSGYMGGKLDNPTYQDVKTGLTGHAEVVEIQYDEMVTNYEKLLKIFMEIHDPCQLDRQGYDKGTQYRSEIFVCDNKQREIAEHVIDLLKNNGYDVVTKITDVSTFYIAEDYHQNYYNGKNSMPSCHSWTKRF